MNEMIVFWLVMLILLLVIEAATLGLTTIWFAGGALLALLAAVLHLPVAVQVILFFVVSLVLLFFTRPVAVKYFNRNRLKTNVESLVGKSAFVTERIDNLMGTGQVRLGAQEWMARSVDEGICIESGAIVTVMAVSGVKLMVRKPDPENQEASEGRQETGTLPQEKVSLEEESI